MEKLGELFNMGGYGIYVWPAYLVALVVITTMSVATVRALKKAQKKLDELKKEIKKD